jgi:hypothetical protein
MTASHPSDNRRFIVAGLFLGSGGRDAAIEGWTASIFAIAGRRCGQIPAFLSLPVAAAGGFTKNYALACFDPAGNSTEIRPRR